MQKTRTSEDFGAQVTSKNFHSAHHPNLSLHADATFKLEVPGYGAYPGHAAVHGTQAAIYFANTDPEFKGRNHGFEVCTQGKGVKREQP